MMPPLFSCEFLPLRPQAQLGTLRLGVTMSAVEAVVLIAVGTAAAIAWAMFSKPSGGATLRRRVARPAAAERTRAAGAGPWRGSANDRF